MTRTLLAIALGAVLGAAAQGPARRPSDRVRPLSEHDIKETIDGKKAAVNVVELNLKPGSVGQPHRHPGPVFGYVLEGEYEIGLGDQPTRVLKAGETFYEPTGILHRVSRNPSDKNKARVLAVLLLPRGANTVLGPNDAPPKTKGEEK